MSLGQVPDFLHSSFMRVTAPVILTATHAIFSTAGLAYITTINGGVLRVACSGKCYMVSWRLSALTAVYCAWAVTSGRQELPGHDVALLYATGLYSLVSSLATALGSSSGLQAIFALAFATLWSLELYFTHNFSFRPSMVIDGALFIQVFAQLGRKSYYDEEGQKPHPVTISSPWTSITLGWLNPLLWACFRGSIDPNSDVLWDLGRDLSVHETVHRLSPQNVELNTLYHPFFLVFLIRQFPRELLFTGLLAAVDIVATFAQPFLLRALLQTGGNPCIIAAMFIAGVTGGSCQSHALYRLRMIGMRTRSMMAAHIYDKSLRRQAASSSTAGRIEPSVLLEADLHQLFMLIEMVHGLWLVPFQIIITSCALSWILDWKSILAGLGSAAVIAPLFTISLKAMTRGMSRVMVAKDIRVRLVQEVLERIKLIKLSGWKNLFGAKIHSTRVDELNAMRKVAHINGLAMFLSYLLPGALISVSLGTHIACGGVLTSEVVFPALAFFAGVTRAWTMVPSLMMLLQASGVSYRRLREFLLCSGVDTSYMDDEGELLDRTGIITVSHVDLGPCGPDAPEEKLLLRDCNMQAFPGQLVTISGPVGSGKSTLLRAIVGDLEPSCGHIQVSGSIAYSPQSPFLIEGSVRDNILFGLPFDAKFYKKVIDACALTTDFKRLPQGDATQIGGASVSLSGGQKSRLVLARTVYARPMVVVLDDPLAALDSKVARVIIDNVLGPEGILKDSIRIASTTSKHLMKAADVLYNIEDSRLDLVFEALGGSAVIDRSSDEDGDDEDSNQAGNMSEGLYGTFDFPQDIPSGVHGRPPTPRTSKVAKGNEDLERASLLAPPNQNSSDAERTVRLKTYFSFFSLAKRWGWPVALATAAGPRVLDAIGVYYLKLGAEEYVEYGKSTKLAYYIACGFTGAFLGYCFILALYLLCLLPAGRAIHSKLTKGVLDSKLSFFDRVPTGDILNRFTNDITKIDGPVAGGMIRITILATTGAASVGVLVAASPASLLYLVPMSFVYIATQSFYLHACRQLRHLEIEARGPILTAMIEAKNGRAVINSFGQSAFFRQKTWEAINRHLRIWIPFLCLDIWLSLRLQLLACFIQLFTATLLVLLKTPPSTLGMVMSFILQITAVINQLVQARVMLEADIVSLERINSYAEISSEENSDLMGSLPPTDWAKRDPKIKFRSYTAAHSLGGKPCLRNITLDISPGERIAVVGRTGAGKSSLALSLLHGLDIEAVSEGYVMINGRDLSLVNPSELRRRVAIVPQEPLIFSGSLRENLDPLNERTDDEIMLVLGRCELVRWLQLQDESKPLEYVFANGGSSLSGGQKQIIAMARAMLTRVSIVILDEVTAMVDHEVEKMIQRLVREDFHNKVILTIAHRIDTILDYDKVIVLDHGRVLEFDAPQTLLKNTNSVFSSIARDAGPHSML